MRTSAFSLLHFKEYICNISFIKFSDLLVVYDKQLRGGCGYHI